MKESNDGSTAGNIFNRLIDAAGSYLVADAAADSNAATAAERRREAARLAALGQPPETNWMPWIIGGVALLLVAGLGAVLLLGGRRGTA